jgi:hypothetical protein
MGGFQSEVYETENSHLSEIIWGLSIISLCFPFDTQMQGLEQIKTQ